MKKVFAPLFLICSLFFSACENSPKPPEHRSESEQVKPSLKATDTVPEKKGKVYYQCPMHPEVNSDKPGTCPKCGMELEKKTK